VGPNNLFNVFLLIINNFRFKDYLRSTHVLLAYFITGLIIVQYYFNLVFIDTKLFLKIV